MNVIIKRYIYNIKTFKMNINIEKLSLQLKALLVLGVISAILFGTISSTLVSADRFQEQINQLNSQNDQIKQSQSVLSVEASSLADAIAKLQAQIDASQARINQLNGEIDVLRQQIKEAEEELEKQKALLGQSIKAMYVSGEISTVEMLASSKDLSDFFDKQQYQESVRSKIKSTLDKVTALKLELNAKKEAVEKSLEEQKSLQAQLSGQRAEKDRILALNQDQQNQLENEIKENTSRISELKRQQAAENARLFARNGGGGIRNVPDTSGYPWADYPFPNEVADPWGMFLRQCVSYTAWKVWKSGRFMPNWGGVGNANQWDDNARRAGIPVDSTPQVGDVAVSNSGYYGHVMYVESINPNGTINISQYNASWTGTYSEATISPNGLVFIHFPW